MDKYVVYTYIMEYYIGKEYNIIWYIWNGMEFYIYVLVSIVEYYSVMRRKGILSCATICDECWSCAKWKKPATG